MGAGLPNSEIKRLQLILNHGVRMIFKARKHQHISPFLMKLHWLPVTARITYKIATLAYKHFEGTLPEYLSSSLHTYTTLDYTTLHYTTLHYTTLHYTTLHYT